MVSTRQSPAQNSEAASSVEEEQEKKKPANDDDDEKINDDNDDESERSSDSDESDESPPKPVSSEDEESDGNRAAAANSNSTNRSSSSTAGAAVSSRLFAPHRTVGVVNSGGAPFHLLPHQNSAQALAACPVGERFQLLQTDRLHPVLVSQAVATAARGSDSGNRQRSNRNKKKAPGASGERRIRHIVTDASLSISVVTHGPSSTNHAAAGAADTVTLFQRTRPLVSRQLVAAAAHHRAAAAAGGRWSICDMVSMGRIQTEMTGEKEGRKENAAVIAVILAKHKDDDDDDGDGDDDDDDDDSSTDSSSSQSSSNDEDTDVDDDGGDGSPCLGRIVVLIATRTSLRIHKRISLSMIPNFCPNVAMHPATYLDKIVVGGSDGSQAAACLVNVRSGKVVHVFECFGSSTSKKKIMTSTNNNGHPGVFVTAIEQSPAIDTVAIGTTRGNVHLVNLKHDKTLFTLRHKSKDGKNNHRPAITSISFRTDGSAMRYGISPMAVGRSDGNITVWDLNEPEDKDMGRTILCEMDRVHPGGVSKLQYFPQEPLLLSTGTSSNSILMHIFDKPDHSARLLRQRRGHSAPPSKIRYLHPGAGAGGGVLANTSDGTDASACQILSSGGPDRALRIFSTARSVLDKEYSQGAGLEKKARQLGLDSTAELLVPPLTDLALCEARSRDWGDLVTIHENHSFAYVWSTRRGAQCGPILRQDGWNVSAMKQPPPSATQATSVVMSPCGSFALVGTRGGTIYRYNVQSGIPRGSYPRMDASDKDAAKRKSKTIGDVHRTTMALEKNLKTNSRSSNLDKKRLDMEESAKRDKRLKVKLQSACHSGHAVTGLAVDAVNKTLISVGADAKLIMWNLQTHAPHKKSPYLLPCPATKMCHVRDSELAAIALNDFSVVLFDCTALSIVRRFGKGKSQHMAPLTDLAFSPDGRNLYTSSLDRTIRVWDVPTNTCVDWLSFQSAPTSITVSPTGEYLATTHANKLGICIWSDKSYYQTVHLDGFDATEPVRMDAPMPMADVIEPTVKPASATLTSGKADTASDEEEEDSKMPAIPKEPGLITLSNLPTAHWKNLFHLELVKQRNKPKQPPKKPPSAPFFLQWRSGEPITSAAPKPEEKREEDDDEWAAAWSDEDNEEGEESAAGSTAASKDTKRIGGEVENASSNKRRKVTHYRSQLATLLRECSTRIVPHGQTRFQPVTDHIASLGPSAIDVEFTTLCNGTHDLEEGLPLLLLASQWLLESCSSRERFEAVNAYLHRFLYLHSFLIAGIGEKDEQTKDGSVPPDQEVPQEIKEERENRVLLLETIAKLKREQQASTERLKGKMEHTLCLLRHFSRMV